MNIVSKNITKTDEEIWTSEANAQLENLKHEFNKFIIENDIRVYREFFNDITWDFFEAWLDDYYTDQNVADDDDAIVTLDGEWDAIKDRPCPYASKQEAFDNHVRAWKAMMEEATRNMLNKRFEKEAKEYGVKLWSQS